MYPDVCRFVSEIVYDGRLDGLPELAAQATAFGTGLRYLPVDHVERIAREIGAMRGGSWTNRKGETCPLKESDFMVVAPYNHQVRLLRRTLQAAGLGNVPVGTVDKFQGREAPVVFYYGHLERRGRAAHPRFPLLAQSPQRRSLARDVPGLHRRQPPPARITRAPDRADAVDQRAVSIRGDGRRA